MTEDNGFDDEDGLTDMLAGFQKEINGLRNLDSAARAEVLGVPPHPNSTRFEARGAHLSLHP